MASFEMHTRPDDKHMRTDWMVALNIESFLQGDCSARGSGIRKSLRHQQLLVLFEYVFSLVIMGANANWWWDCSDFAEPWSTKAWEHMTERSLNPKVSHSMLGDCGHHIEEFFMSMSEQIQCGKSSQHPWTRWGGWAKSVNANELRNLGQRDCLALVLGNLSDSWSTAL